MENGVAFEMTLKTGHIDELLSLVGAHARSVVALTHARNLEHAAAAVHRAARIEEGRAREAAHECLQRHTDEAIERLIGPAVFAAEKST